MIEVQTVNGGRYICNHITFVDNMIQCDGFYQISIKDIERIVPHIR